MDLFMCRIASLFLLQRPEGRMSGDARDFNNMETRAVKFFFLQGKAPKEIQAILRETLGEHAPLYATVKNWVAHRAFATQKKLVYLDFQCLDHPPYSQDLAPSDYHLFPGLKKTIERSPFFVRRGGHCCHGDLVGRTTFWIFFEWLAKVRATGLFPSWSG